MLLSGEATRLGDYHHAIDLLGALRLCSNVPGQFAVPAALEGPDTITALCVEGGRLHSTRAAVIKACAQSEHLSLVLPQGALYAFPAVVGDAAEGFDDHLFALELLEVEGVLVVPGTSFNFKQRNHFRVTLLPEAGTMAEVFRRIDSLLERRAQAQRRRNAAVA
jgi:alanine-synthesizing transaminase